MTAKKDSVSFKDVYELVDGRTQKIDEKMERLVQRFDTLEAGRLTANERAVLELKVMVENELSKVKASQSIDNSKIMLIWGMILFVLNLAGAYIIKVLGE